MYNAMNPIGPRPYTMGNGYKKEEESEGKTQDSLQQNGRQGQQNQERQQQKREPKTIASGKASDVAPRRRNVMSQPPANNTQSAKPNPKPVRRQVKPMPTPPAQKVQEEPVQQATPAKRPIQPVQEKTETNEIKPQVYESEDGREIEADSRPIAATSNKVNIAQILKDFRNTISAIGTPDILREEVEDYLKEVEEHCKGEAPSINFVQTNLMNAAEILDRYISETLEKESKVVTKWLDALFLQRINYRYNDGEVNKAFLVKFPETEEEKRAKAEQAKQEQLKQEQETQQKQAEETATSADTQTVYEPIYTEPVAPEKPITEVAHVTSPINNQPQQFVPEITEKQPAAKKPEIKIIPEDNELKSLFIQAKKHAFAHNPSKAMDIFHRALIRAEQIRDGESQSKICLEMGKIYGENNYLVQALSSYNKSLKSTTDNNLKTKAHYSMAMIYDDVHQIESAINHYMTSVSYAGANNDLPIQCTSLTRIANIFSRKSDKKAFEFYNEADELIQQTDDSKTKGFVSSNTANAYTTFDKPEIALKYYAKAVKNYSDIKEQDDIAENYKAAAELMIGLKNSAKARVLLTKALNHADKSKDEKLINEINSLMAAI